MLPHGVIRCEAERADADSRERLEKIFLKLRKQEALTPELLDAPAGEIEKLM